jgi:hypothetical protein
MEKTKKFGLAAFSFATMVTLSACGGGGGSSSTSSGSSSSNTSGSSSTVTGTVSTPQYAATSAQLAAFSLLNQYRTECGFPAVQENTVLDSAAQNHAKYMGLNGAVSDTEVSGNQGYTGASYVDRATAAGFPMGAGGLGVSTGYATFTSNFSSSQAGQQMVYSLLSGVYHVAVAAYPVSTIGIGEYETQFTDSNSNHWTEAWGTMSLLNTKTQTLSNAPLTFPCQGVTGVAYGGVSESPTPPNVSGTGWGTPVTVMGTTSDTVVVQSASITGPSGSVALQILNSTTDPHTELPSFESVIYPTSPLSASTQYSVSLTGTINGTPFSRSFTFTTGNFVG